MNKAIIEERKNKAAEYLKILQEDSEQKRKISIIFQYLSSILNSDQFSETQNEDFRKLALELGFQEDTDFDVWKTLQNK